MEYTYISLASKLEVLFRNLFFLKKDLLVQPFSFVVSEGYTVSGSCVEAWHRSQNQRTSI